jgi:hypothetical protein
MYWRAVLRSHVLASTALPRLPKRGNFRDLWAQISDPQECTTVLPKGGARSDVLAAPDGLLDRHSALLFYEESGLAHIVVFKARYLVPSMSNDLAA